MSGRREEMFMASLSGKTFERAFDLDEILSRGPDMNKVNHERLCFYKQELILLGQVRNHIARDGWFERLPEAIRFTKEKGPNWFSYNELIVREPFDHHHDQGQVRKLVGWIDDKIQQYELELSRLPSV